MHTAAAVLALGLTAFLALSETPESPTPSQKSAKKKTARKRAPAVVVPAAVRKAAFEAVSARAAAPSDTLEGAGALVPFFERISRASGPVHILQYGDSHTASDDWAAEMRQNFQRKFGDGGPGFTLPGHPFLGYRRFDSRGSNSKAWYTNGIVTRKSDGIDGLSGISLTAHAPAQTVSLSVECQQLELHYLQQPAGGQVEFSVDGASVGRIDSNGEFGLGIYRYTPSPGPHKYALRTLSGDPVRLFGWVAQNESGVTYETLGINGAQAEIQLSWNASILNAEIADRDPALIVVAYGTNEALSRTWTEDAYRSALREMIQRLRAAASLASILLVGPPDCQYRLRNGRRLPFPHLDQVINIQRQVALETGCAFWDWRARMGGEGSVRQWVQAGLSQPDYTHLTGQGYRMLGDMLFSEIMMQYDRFQNAMAGRPNGQ
jgi:lysophospholipase L1-like esterase